MLEFTRVSRWFHVANGYTLRYSQAGSSWRVCAPGGRVLGTVGDLGEAERVANRHAEDAASAEAALSAPEEDEPDPPFDAETHPVEVRGYSDDDIKQTAADQGIGEGAAMMSLIFGAPYEALVAPSGQPDPATIPGAVAYNNAALAEAPEGRYLTEGHGSARMVAETNDDTGDVTMKPCQCLSPTGAVEDDALVVSPCGGEVPNKREFRPGHDAKLKSTLIKAYRAGGKLVILDGGSRTETTAEKLADERSWTRFLTDAPARKARKGKADTTSTDDAVFAGDRGELDPESLREPVGASQPAQVKVRGAWKDGFVTKIEAGETASGPQLITVTYTNAKRKQVTVTHPSDSDKLKMG